MEIQLFQWAAAKNQKPTPLALSGAWNNFDALLDACREYQKAIVLLRECNPKTEIAIGSVFQINKADELGTAAITEAEKPIG